MYKVLIISRSTLYSAPGGDSIQIEETAKALRTLGIKVDIKLTNEVISYSGYDLLHFFNIIRPADIVGHIAKSKLPYVISTIFVDYEEYEKNKRRGLLKLLNYFLNGDSIEYLKVIVRIFKGQEKVNNLSYFFTGQKTSIRQILKQAGVLLPNSQNEYMRLLKKYKVPQKFIVVPNGINTKRFAKPCSTERSIILCVARFEPLKNQLNLIRAVKSTQHKLYLIGKASPNSKSYYELCKREATDNIIFIDHMTQEQLLEYYKIAKVHVLASWFETTGLSSLEAAAMGCNIVITEKGDTRDYFKDYAFYCNPNSVESIKDAITKAYTTQYNPHFDSYINENFTWENAARKTLEGYKLALSK